jgi:ferrochelatase
LRERLRERGTPLPVYVGMRNWDPYLKDTLAAMSRDGVRRAVGFIAAAHRSYSSCTQYRENVEAARAELRAAGLADVEITYVSDWHVHPGFIEANVDHVRRAWKAVSPESADPRLIFTAHSIPVSMAQRFPYERQLRESAAAIVAALTGRPTTVAARSFSSASQSHPVPHSSYDLVYQSRSGRPEDPWLGPDICDYLRAEAANGLTGAVLCPVGFICDHVEVLYDLDTEAAGVARAIGLPLARASAVNDHPRFIDTMADAVIQTVDRYRSGRPLRMVPTA